MASKASRTTNFREQGKRLLAKLGRDFPEVESKGYGSKTSAKKTKAWEEILTKFNSQNLNGMKRDLSQLQGCWRRLKLLSKKEHDLHRREARKTGGRKAPALSSEVNKLVADVIPASVNPLEQEFDDDAGELDLRRDKDKMEVITCKVGPSLLADVETITRKEAAKVTKKDNSQKYNNLQSLLNYCNDTSLHNLQLLIIRQHYIDRCKRRRPDSSEADDPFLSKVRGEHKLKIIC